MAVELRPLPGIEVTRTGATFETKLRLASLQQLSRHDRAGPLAKPACKKRLIAAAFGDGDKRFLAPGDPKQPGINRRGRRKDAAREASCHGEFEPRPPVDAELRARPQGRTLFGQSPLDDDVSGRERDNGVEQTPQDRGATVERRVCDHLERCSRQLNAQGIVDAHIHKWIPALQAFSERGSDLDGDDTRAGAHERRRQDTCPSTEIENEVVGLNARSANKLRG
jgi:hypothetical protein